MKLYVEDEEALPAVKYLIDADPTPSGYTETTDPIDWDTYYAGTSTDYKKYRNEMIDQFEPGWSGYSDDQKKALVRNYIYPSETSSEDLDALYSESDRDDYQNVVMDKMNIGLTRIEMSSESRKHFEVRINDSGVSLMVEIKSDIKI